MVQFRTTKETFRFDYMFQVDRKPVRLKSQEAGNEKDKANNFDYVIRGNDAFVDSYYRT